jgi:hypothetical protein
MQNIANGETTQRKNQIIGLKGTYSRRNIKSQLKLYGHVRRMGEERAAKAAVERTLQKEGNGEGPRHLGLTTYEGQGMAGTFKTNTATTEKGGGSVWKSDGADRCHKTD